MRKTGLCGVVIATLFGTAGLLQHPSHQEHIQQKQQAIGSPLAEAGVNLLNSYSDLLGLKTVDSVTRLPDGFLQVALKPGPTPRRSPHTRGCRPETGSSSTRSRRRRKQQAQAERRQQRRRKPSCTGTGRCRSCGRRPLPRRQTSRAAAQAAKQQTPTTTPTASVRRSLVGTSRLRVGRQLLDGHRKRLLRGLPVRSGRHGWTSASAVSLPGTACGAGRGCSRSSRHVRLGSVAGLCGRARPYLRLPQKATNRRRVPGRERSCLVRAYSP